VDVPPGMFLHPSMGAVISALDAREAA